MIIFYTCEYGSLMSYNGKNYIIDRDMLNCLMNQYIAFGGYKIVSSTNNMVILKK